MSADPKMAIDEGTEMDDKPDTGKENPDIKIDQIGNSAIIWGYYYDNPTSSLQDMSLKTVEKWTLFVPITGLKSTLEKKSKSLVYISPE